MLIHLCSSKPFAIETQRAFSSMDNQACKLQQARTHTGHGLTKTNTVWITPRSLAPKGRSTVINGASRAHFQIRKLPSIESRHVTEPILGTFAGHRLVRVAE